MKYLIYTTIIFFSLSTIQYAQVNVQSSTGNVTIGSLAAASEKLEVKGRMLIDGNVRINGAKFLQWENSGARKAYLYYSGTDLFMFNDDPSGDIILNSDRFFVRTTDVERLTILNNGKVGIGDSTPNEMLTVNGNVAITPGNSLGFYESNNLKAGVAFNGTDMFMTNLDGAATIIGETYVAMDVNGVEHMRVALNGNIGVNVLAPTERLHVNGGIRLGNSVGNANGTIRFSGGDIQGRVGGSWVSLTSAGGGGGNWSSSSGNLFYNSGNVGIGTNSPAHTLQVNGNIGISGEILGVSDIRVKKNINNINQALNVIKSLHPVTYEFNGDHGLEFPEGTQLGFIAQELETVLPDLVSVSAVSNNDKDEAMQLKGINYLQMIPLLTKAIQEQESKMEMQSRQIQKQQEILDKQTKLIDMLLSKK